MPDSADFNPELNRAQQALAFLEQGQSNRAARLLAQLEPSDIAYLLESSPPQIRGHLWRLLPPELAGNALPYLSEDVQLESFRRMDVAAFREVAQRLESDDLADLLQQLPSRRAQQLLRGMEPDDRQRLEALLAYAEDTAGGLMNIDTVRIRADVRLAVVLRYLRRHRSLPEATDSLLVTNRQGILVGALPLTRLLVSHPNTTVREIMDTDIDKIPVDMPDTEVARLFSRHDLVTAPVVDLDGQLLGRITIDDVVDVIQEDADHSLMSMAGLDEDEDTFAPVRRTIPRRALWLGINLLTALLASAVIGLFKDTIEQVVALAVLMPIVASMGGIAGNQTLTLVIRAIALGQLSGHNVRWLVNREFLLGILNGFLWGLVVALAAVIWFQDMRIGAVIAAAMVTNLVVAALAGSLLPLLLQARKIDPALAGGVILTTLTDVTGFLSFLGLATLVYA